MGNDRSERKEQNERRACAKRGVRGEQRDGDDGRRGAEAAKAGSGTAPPRTGYGSWEWKCGCVIPLRGRHLRCGGAQYRGERGARKSVGGPGNAQAKGLRCQGRVPSVECGGGGGEEEQRRGQPFLRSDAVTENGFKLFLKRILICLHSPIPTHFTFVFVDTLDRIADYPLAGYT